MGLRVERKNNKIMDRRVGLLGITCV